MSISLQRLGKGGWVEKKTETFFDMIFFAEKGYTLFGKHEIWRSQVTFFLLKQFCGIEICGQVSAGAIERSQVVKPVNHVGASVRNLEVVQQFHAQLGSHGVRGDGLGRGLKQIGHDVLRADRRCWRRR